MMKRYHYFLALAAALILSISTTPLAWAVESTGTSVVGEDGNLTYSQTYPAGEEAPVLPETISSGSQNFILESSAAGIDPDFVKPTQTFTRQAYSQVPLAGAGNWRAYFPAFYPINEGEFQGEIGLDPVTPFTIYERYHSYRVQVDRQAVFTGLPDNDVTRLPTTQNFQVVSDVTPGATMTATLQILAVEYEIAGTDHLGYPNSFTAYVTYRGQEGLHELAYYDVTANYQGTLESSVDQFVVTATYTPVVEIVIPPQEIPLDETAVALPASEPSYFPLVIAGTTVVVLIALPLLMVFFLKNARLIRVSKQAEDISADSADGISAFEAVDESQDQAGKQNKKAAKKNTKPELAELICRRRLVLRDGLAQFVIPSDVDIFDGSLYCLTISPSFASREGDVCFVWQDKIVAEVQIARHIDIDFREMLITSTEAALLEADLLD